MTLALSPTTMPPTDQTAGASALRAAAPGVCVGMAIALAAGLGAFDGLATQGAGVGPWIALGAVLAAATGSCGAVLKGRAVLRSAVDPQAGSALQIALLGDFVLQLFMIGVGTLALYLAELKFDLLAGFALAFATVALAHQAGSALVLTRALRQRARHRAAGPGPSHSTSDSRPADPPSTHA